MIDENMKHLISEEDYRFKERVEKLVLAAAEFDHKAHLRLAYIYLSGNSVSKSVDLMRHALHGLLEHAGIEPSEKYHETLTKAWILAVCHFMKCSAGSSSSEHFLKENEVLLNPKVMLTHYSESVLFSKDARVKFIEPDLEQIPRHAA